MRYLLIFGLLVAGASRAQRIEARAGAVVIDGRSPDVRVTNLKPGEHVVIEAYRRLSSGNQAHAFGEFIANERGEVVVNEQASVRGTYEGKDALGLLWSGEKLKEPGPALTGRQVIFELRRDGAKAAECSIQLSDGSELLEIREVKEGPVNGVFARPKKAGPGALPAIILLHGSEGGSMAEARRNAVRFAQLGYAAFGLNYFVFGGDDVALPKGLLNIPVEHLSLVREWLAKQAGVDAERASIWGVSKGAELALVAAANLDWVDRAVACVPSSVVWEGFGRPLAAGEVASSWTVGGKSLAYIKYDHYEDSFQGKISAAGVHKRSLVKATEEERAAARIPIERTRAQLLVMGATRDQVWPSAEMVGEIEAAMKRAGKAKQIRALVFRDASHFVCGVGDEVTRIDPVKKPEGNDPKPEADARGSAESWTQTVSFLGIHE